ncbi:type II toxin-antitoxin system RelE/ParE family toxin [Pontibacter qinzhouensis]|uniref:Type II toxin-antitoxin system RelE/ParE family toxin n=1 Tax=Pontibacter qinzhouensis TaxID=2603253 RepID=A0A5C8KD87_9BACT|nr:type II toxin-antitoxin system RelE/ParE family toxin [Pontibacter qinzhouensis]
MDGKEIRWSLKAIQDKIAILDYWMNRNKSKAYSQKLDRLFDRALNSAARNPASGKKTDYRNVRIRIVSHYLIFYLIQEKHIEVVRILDSRRNLSSLNL